MEVRSRVNQADVNNIAAGQPVKVSLDAYPELAFTGKVDRLAAIGLTSGLNRKVRSFQAVFTIDGNSPQLMPDLSAAVDVEIARQHNVLIAPRSAVLHEGNDDFLMVRGATGFDKRKVTVSALNDVDAVISAGVDEGAVIARTATLERTALERTQGGEQK
jgi:hypothetical protein